MITKEEALNTIAAKHGLSNWMYASMIKETIELEEIIFEAMELYAQSNSHIASVSGKRPTDDEITLVISEIANHFNSGLSNALHQEYYITKVRELFQAACASGAVDTVAERGFYCSESDIRYVPCKEQCIYCETKLREAPSGGQP